MQKMTMDEWRFLHSPRMFYDVYGSGDPAAEQIALAALRESRYEAQAEEYTVNIESNVEVSE